MGAMILTTARLVLRPMIRDYAAALFAILGDPEAMTYWARPPLPRLATMQAQIEDELAGMAAGSFFCWTALAAGTAIGSIDLKPSANDEAWIGFAFRREYWGQGLAREGVAAVLDHGFAPMALSRIAARVQAGNARAIRLLEHLNFQPRGRAADIMRDGESRPCLRYELRASVPAD